jgi:hypothetical protein
MPRRAGRRNWWVFFFREVARGNKEGGRKEGGRRESRKRRSNEESFLFLIAGGLLL